MAMVSDGQKLNQISNTEASTSKINLASNFKLKKAMRQFFFY